MQRVENFLFRFRATILICLVASIGVMGYFATKLQLDAGFEKMLPIGHEFIDTLKEYQNDFGGGNRLIVAVESVNGSIWTPEYLEQLRLVTDEIFYIPGVFRGSVTSLWTPNTRYLEITEVGIDSGNVIPGDFQNSEESIGIARSNALKAGLFGRLIGTDFKSSLITADLQDIHPETRQRLNYFEVGDALEAVRTKFESDDISIKIIGFAKLTDDIAAGLENVIIFFIVAFILTVLMLYLYCRSWILTAVTLAASASSLVWQFGFLHFMGIGIDPLAVLVPFLVFAIGVSHGVQQVNMITAEMAGGKSKEEAARYTFTFLFVPGLVALSTTMVGFATLYIIPIQMIRELAIMASLGVALKMISNLIMLPLMVSYIAPTGEYAKRVRQAMESRERFWPYLAKIAKPRNAYIMVTFCAILAATGLYISRDLQIGDVNEGAAELSPDSRYNTDTAYVVDHYDIGVDILQIIVETPEGACVDYRTMEMLDRFQWEMANIPGVASVQNLAGVAKYVSTLWREGNMKWSELPRASTTLGQAIGPIQTSSGLLNSQCTVLPTYIFTQDHKAQTIIRVVEAVRAFKARPENQVEGVNLRLASGNVGVMAATNQVVAEAELPMLLYVYAVISSLVLLTYREWRGALCCLLPLIVSTIIGNWFLTWADIGLKISTLPVLAIAVGIGVDYGIYEYNRIQRYMAAGRNPYEAYLQALKDVGSATMFTGFTLAVGVSTWAFSDLQFQPDMGLLLTFMFMVNMIAAVTLLPALVSVFETAFPRRKPFKIPTILGDH